LMAINPIPTSRIPRRGWISAQISGNELQFTFFLGFFSAASPELPLLDERSPEWPLTDVGVYVERKDIVPVFAVEGYLFDARTATECTPRGAELYLVVPSCDGGLFRQIHP
jgi:hypothetical protein